MDKQAHEEIHELKHDPIPGYKTIFSVVFAVFSIYLLVILFVTFGGAK